MGNSNRLCVFIVFFLVLSMCSLSLTKATQLISDNDKDIFYIEDNIRTRTQLKIPTANSNNWTLESKIEKCYDNSLIGKAASRMIADGETKISITLRYMPDDDKRVIESQEVKFYFYNGDDLFHDSDKQLVTGLSQFVGNYSCENTQKNVAVHLTAPVSYPLTIPSKAYTDESFNANLSSWKKEKRFSGKERIKQRIARHRK